MGLRLLRSRRGITLVDVAVGLAIFGLAAAAIFAGVKGALNAWTIAHQITGEQHNARMTLEWVVRRLRMAGQGTVSIAISFADRSEIAFWSWGECYRIYLDTGIVYTARTADCSRVGQQPLSAAVEARNLTVTRLSFRYFDDSDGPGSELTNLPLSFADRGRVRRVEVQIDVSGQFLAPLRMATQVSVR